MTDPLVFSPREHRYSLALRHLPATTRTIADVGGYRSRAELVTKYVKGAEYTAVNVGPAWYPDGDFDVTIEGVTLPLPDASFDAAICVDTLEHVRPEDRRALIGEVCRISRHHAAIVVPFCGGREPDEETLLLQLTRSGGIADMPSLVEHLMYGLPTLDELRDCADEFGLEIVPGTARALYWAGQWAMAINQLALGEAAESTNRTLLEWQEEYLARLPDPATFDGAYRAVLYRSISGDQE
jgi:SAM-dependent methyltransferase